MPDIQTVEITKAKPRRPAVKLTTQEIATAFTGKWGDEYPPVLSLAEAAKLIRLKTSTLKRKVSEGYCADCVSRGKPLLFWRERLIQHLFKNQD